MSLYAILSDIHGNMHALNSVVEDMSRYSVNGIIILGDIIDYGMQSNEVVEYVKKQWDGKIICNIWGNHEKAILTHDFTHFSSQRGVESARYTSSILTQDSMDYLNGSLIQEGKYIFSLKGKKFLAIHGSLQDPFWKAISPDNLRGDYREYDLVLSGHSHYSHMFTEFYDIDNPVMRNKHAVVFLNPGSVGQPRNHNPAAQYALLNMETMSITMRSVKYDVKAAMSLYDGKINDFYRDRLFYGI